MSCTSRLRSFPTILWTAFESYCVSLCYLLGHPRGWVEVVAATMVTAHQFLFEATLFCFPPLYCTTVLYMACEQKYFLVYLN